MCPVSFLAAEMKHNDKVMCILHDRERRDRKQLCRAINDFQQSFQKPETRREFDLSDPLALKKDLPARVSDNDMRNTISGMQKFMGEDLNFHERKRFQQEQNREWALQQHREWERARADHKLAGNQREERLISRVFPAQCLWMLLKAPPTLLQKSKPRSSESPSLNVPLQYSKRFLSTLLSSFAFCCCDKTP